MLLWGVFSFCFVLFFLGGGVVLFSSICENKNLLYKKKKKCAANVLHKCSHLITVSLGYFLLQNVHFTHRNQFVYLLFICGAQTCQII